MFKKIKLNYLKYSYEDEISLGIDRHVKDLIAVSVILDLSCVFPVYEYYNFNEIKLGNLIEDRYFKDNKYMVPDIKLLEEIRNNYEKKLSKPQIPVGTDKNYAAMTWLILMQKFGFIKENDIIDLNEYKLVDFITDDRLINMFRANIETNKYKKVLKKN